jgi:HTH-type transcriptional regulator/antitoxin MqsA
LQLTQSEAGNIVGGGPRAFQKYEKGVVPPSDAAIGLLEILNDDPSKIELLKKLRESRSSVPDHGQGHVTRRKASRRDSATA